MAVEISLKKGTANPTSGLTLAEPLFNSTNNTLWMGKGSGVTPIWLGAGICGASGGIAAGLTYQIPTLGAVKDYISSIGTIGATGATGATGVQGATGATGPAGPTGSNFTGYDYEIHVSQVDGNDTTGNGDLLTPVASITKALTLVDSQRKTIIVHPGTYTESPSITVQYTTITGPGLIGGNIVISGTVSTNTGCTISGIKMTNLTVTTPSGAGNVNILNCEVSGIFTKSSNADYTVLRLCDLTSASITGAGLVAIFGGNPNSITVNNASATVIVKSAVTVSPVLTAGALSIVDCVVGAAATNAVTSAASSVITLANSQLLTSALNNVAPVVLNGFYSILNCVYDKPNSTLAASSGTGGSYNSIDYFQYINADKFITQGGTSSQFVKGDGSLDSNVVISFNGRTGAVQGVSAAVAGTGISVSGATGAVTITNTGVQSFNGVTGAVTGASLGANTFTALNTFNAGISASGATLSSNTTIPSGSTLTVNGNFVANGNVNLGDAVTDAITVTGVLAANGGLSAAGGTFSSLTRFTAGISSAGGTFSSLTRFTAGITASTLYVSGGATFGNLTATNIYSNNLNVGSGLLTNYIAPYTGTVININYEGNLTTIGDYGFEGDSDFANNTTYISVNDTTQTVRIRATNGIDNNGSFLNTVTAPSFTDTYSFVQTYRTTTTATTANQTIATIDSVYDNGAIPPEMFYPAFEVTISARDTVLNKIEMLKMLVVQDGTNTVNTQYGLIRTGATGPVSSYSTTLSGTPRNLLIRATPLSTNNTVFTTTVRAQSDG